MIQRAHLPILRQFVAREFRQRYLGSLTGPAWALLQPLMLLGVYALVFVHVLRVRLPAGDGPADAVPFLVAALWPWTAFAEGLNRAVQAVPENAALLAKVPVPRSLLVIAPLAVTFAVHGLGLCVVGLVLALWGRAFDIAGVLPALVVYLLLAGFTLGVALLLAAWNVFVRDVGQILGQALTLLFFLSPVFFTREMVPEAFRIAFDLNPLSIYLDLIRALLLGTPVDLIAGLGKAAAATTMTLILGVFVFRRLSPHFEDYL
jgi:ABC-type polysaccharide/polyol phosphate export permease